LFLGKKPDSFGMVDEPCRRLLQQTYEQQEKNAENAVSRHNIGTVPSAFSAACHMKRRTRYHDVNNQ
jgi:hypothetical protein